MRPTGKVAASYHWEWFKWLVEEDRPNCPVDFIHQEYSDHGVAKAMATCINLFVSFSLSGY